MTASIRDSSLSMEWVETPWDSKVVGAPVLQITEFDIRGSHPLAGFRKFEEERDRLAVGLVSCRLPHDHLVESMFLEDRGFRFVEMIFGPEIVLDAVVCERQAPTLSVARASEQDLPELLAIAGSAFSSERFHIDPRLGPVLGAQRYRNWVQSCLHHRSQKLFAVRDGEAIVAVFIAEALDHGVCYWHLTAVAPAFQGQGFGRRAWLTMMRHAYEGGASLVRTSVAARNHRVINLYARLGFRFPEPLMTFHWLPKALV